MKLISVIIPTFGLPQFLESSIQSVLNQTIDNWELIIVDDNNPDTEERILTQKIITKFDNPKIKYITHPRNLNGAVARNTGIKEAKGEYISFLDSDDFYLPSRLEKCLQALEKEKEYNAVYTGAEIRVGGRTHAKFKRPKTGNFLIETLSANFYLYTGSNIFMRADTVRGLNGFDEKFLRHQDYEFIARFFLNNDILSIPEILVVKNNENFNLPNPEKMELIKHQYLEKFSQVIKALPKEDQNKIFHFNYSSLGEAYLRSGNRKESARCYSEASKFMHLTSNEIVRRLIFYCLSLIKQK